MITPDAEQDTAAPERRRTAERALHVFAGVVVVVGVLAALLRPLAPELAGPVEAARWFDADYLARAAAYREPRYAAAALGLLLRVAVPCLVAFTPPGRRLVSRIVERLQGRPTLSAVAVVLAIVVATDLVVLPLAFWVTYVHDGLYGFRTQGLAGWVRDWIVLTLPAWALVGALAAGGWWLARRFPRTWPALGGLGASAVLAVLVALAPVALEPLQFRTEPLAPGDVRAAVESVVARDGRPVGDIVVADASRRSTRQNAYVSGLGPIRRIVLYDNLVEGQSAAVVAQVVAHELAHDRHGDLGRATLLGAAGVVLAAYALHAVLAWRVRRGRQGSVTDPRSAGAVVAVLVLLIVASHPVQNVVSRQYEAAADLGALNLTEDPATYIQQRRAVTEANLGDPAPPAWVRFLWSSHPSAVERLEMGDQWPMDWRGPVRP